ncbi:hypothetical protein VTN00DRAFT_1080 [Thermoascus crustaceus]|uniref:uncharacterized protein n=1 Tax=Thermoascus crustaceus TaxID=5088 RepID=UPI003743B455
MRQARRCRIGTNMAQRCRWRGWIGMVVREEDGATWRRRGGEGEGSLHGTKRCPGQVARLALTGIGTATFTRAILTRGRGVCLRITVTVSLPGTAPGATVSYHHQRTLLPLSASSAQTLSAGWVERIPVLKKIPPPTLSVEPLPLNRLEPAFTLPPIFIDRPGSSPIRPSQTPLYYP